MTFIKEFFDLFKGRTFIFLGLIIFTVIGLIFGIFNLADSMRENDLDTRNLYLLSSQTNDSRSFNYHINTKAGNILAEGDLTISNKDCVKFDEMNQCFSGVSKKKEVYETRIETYSCGKDNKDTCTRVISEWVYYGIKSVSSEKVTFLDKEFNYNFLEILGIIL